MSPPLDGDTEPEPGPPTPALPLYPEQIGSLAADGHVVLDSKALNNLEIFENTFDRGSAGTLFESLNHTCSAFGARLLREWLCAPPRRIEDIEARQQSVAALMEHGEVRDELRPVLKKLPDLERLLARVHGFAGKQAKNSATHYEDIGKAKLGCFIKVLEGFEMLDGAVQRLKPQLGELGKAAPRLAQSLTHGEGFPDLSSALLRFRERFDWALAAKEGRVVPKPGTDTEYDNAERKIKAAVAELKRIERHWQAELRDQSICFWTPQLQSTEPFQLAVSEETLRKRGTPEEFEMKSSKKGTKRFWTEEIEEQVAVYIEGKAEQERALTLTLTLTLTRSAPSATPRASSSATSPLSSRCGATASAPRPSSIACSASPRSPPRRTCAAPPSP